MSAMLLLQNVGSYKISHFGSLSDIEMSGNIREHLATFFLSRKERRLKKRNGRKRRRMKEVDKKKEKKLSG